MTSGRNLRGTVIEYWYRISFKHRIDINGIIGIIIDYATLFQILQFDANLNINVELSDNDKCASKSANRNHGLLLPKIKPVKNGTHVWRIKMENPDKTKRKNQYSKK